MESPPSFSTHSETPALSDDSGLIVTSGSFSSDSVSGLLHIPSELQESDCDEKSLLQYDFQDATEHMCGDNFNTVKKGPTKVLTSTIEPPLQFQDSPKQQKQSTTSDDSKVWTKCRAFPEQNNFSLSSFRDAASGCTKKCCDKISEWRHSIHRPRLLQLSPCHGNVRPSSRGSLQTSRLSSSHNSLTTQTEADISNFITQAISHDTLSTGTSDIADMYNVPFDSDIYTIPIDSVRPSHKMKFQRNRLQNSFHHTGQVLYPKAVNNLPLPPRIPLNNINKNLHASKSDKVNDAKRHSLPGTSWNNQLPVAEEPTHVMFSDIKSFVRSLDTDMGETKNKIVHPTARSAKTIASPKDSHNVNNNNVSFNSLEENLDIFCNESMESNNNNLRKNKKHIFTIKHSKKYKESKEADEGKSDDASKQTSVKKSPVKSLSLNFKQTICNLFRLKRINSVEGSDDENTGCSQENGANSQPTTVTKRALPSVPQTPHSDSKLKHVADDGMDFPTSIQIVKDHGWYWGPISVDASEKLLMSEPDGSFILRDSSDDHYIFTISFKLNGGVRHVRIEHDQGKFCFGSCTIFKARTIVEFIENAVETSRSGRYLFFLNLRPVLGPVRVQLLYPVSRFMRVQSLQHTCRFMILKHVRRDLIDELPLPRRLIDYLSTPQYYSEMLTDS
ncbi:uncharacterized protein LOC143922525 [Arctopsyche grandis]|uniref:uncharacterized protein LOC143922525 n=1 Tax=Arctopsyche grandis TaxID=121162 RepID=UPI00406D903A